MPVGQTQTGAQQDVIDAAGFRFNVGIILANAKGKLLLAKRLGQDAWQFPQGGVLRGETPKEAMYRELHEELGLRPEHVSLVGSTRGWLRYRLPRRFIRRNSKPVCVGQKQKWFLLRLESPESRLRFDAAATPEFDDYRWVDPDVPPREVIFFKRKVYRRAIRELTRLLDGEQPTRGRLFRSRRGASESQPEADQTPRPNPR